jgi:hypothetical protein
MFTFAAPIGRKGIVLRKVGKEVLGRRFERIGAWKKRKKTFGNNKNLLTFAIPKRGDA